MKRLASAALFIAVVCSLALPAFSQTLVVGTCKTAKHQYTTIQSAVDAAPANATVLVCPGTYAEQITITAPLTLEGISVPPLPNPTIIGPASGMADGDQPVIGVGTHGTHGPVNIQGLVINDPICMGESRDVSAIEYVSTSGTVTGTVMQGFGNPTCGGYGIRIENDDAWPVNVELANNFIGELLPYATAIEVTSGPSSSKLVVQIHDNLVSNAGMALKSSTNGNGVWVYGNSFNGFPVGLNAVVLNDAAMMDHNDITFTYGDPDDLPSAIAAYGDNAIITGNTINADGRQAVGISVAGNHVRVWSNKITGDFVSGDAWPQSAGIVTSSASADIRWNIVGGFNVGIDMGCTAATVVSNTILDSATGIAGVPTTATPVNSFVNDTNLLQACP